MPPTVMTIVEGHGEVKALPLLIRRIAHEAGHFDLNLPTPIRCPKSKVIRPRGELVEAELTRAIHLAANKLPCREEGAILILYDADEGCPAELGPRIADLAHRIRPDIHVGIVLAKSEYEAWFLAAAESLKRAGKLGPEASPPPDPEDVSDAKRMLANWMGPGKSYSETVDQPKFTHVFDLEEAKGCKSFAKLLREVEKILQKLYPEASRHSRD